MKNKNAGKSKCCRAKVEYSGGGYDGEDLCPVVKTCTGCGESSPYLNIIRRVGRPSKTIF